MNRVEKRRYIKGIVVSNKMNKTVVVNVSSTMKHPVYNKVVTRSKKYYAHDESDALNIGDEVIIEETRPLSKLKRWRVIEKMTLKSDKKSI